MPSKRILKSTVRIYHYVGEVDYRATYEVYTATGCYVTAKRGTSRSMTDAEPANEVKLYIFDTDTIVRKSDGSRVYFSEQEKADGNWTVSPNGKDYFCVGGSGETPDTEMPNCYKIVDYTRRATGSKRIHHVEVIAK